MNNVVDYPLLVFVLSLFAMWVSVRIGASLLRRWRNLEATASEEFAVIQGVTLTLLGLITAFSISMAVSRYDLRESYEEAEANAIHTEYVRADLLPAADALTVRELLKRYLDQRVLFYKTRDAKTASADQCRYRSTTDRAVVCGPDCGGRAAGVNRRLRGYFGHARCVELARLHHAGCLVGPNPNRGMGSAVLSWRSLSGELTRSNDTCKAF
ncbi:hypothetical protein [Paraburkholderia hospita]|uniref:hypothetical protein n=1 Tax=Paraburkholderia hospita TaxID=169430 RepID=UPI000B3469BE|nr:hypothetical protein [Paraburkholderia hospita]